MSARIIPLPEHAGSVRARWVLALMRCGRLLGEGAVLPDGPGGAA